MTQSQMFARVVAASVAGSAPAIYTLHLRYPRIIHSEIMTHRVFSRNARSSRAVPVAKMIEEVRNTPFVPWHWGANQGGMQAGFECNEPIRAAKMCHLDMIDNQFDPISREQAWLWARDNAIASAEAFMKAGYHKQIANRLLEPFMWIDTLVTSTDWANFLALRDHPAAEPHFQDLAKMVATALDRATYELLEPGEWHLPYITEADRKWAREQKLEETPFTINELLCKISAARCARISYAPFDGDASYEKELARYDLLVSQPPVHASPVEHQATPDVRDELDNWDQGHLHGNLRGWIQFRKLIPGEAVKD